jgi:hypothetical protein
MGSHVPETICSTKSSDLSPILGSIFGRYHYDPNPDRAMLTIPLPSAIKNLTHPQAWYRNSASGDFSENAGLNPAAEPEIPQCRLPSGLY